MSTKPCSHCGESTQPAADACTDCARVLAQLEREQGAYELGYRTGLANGHATGQAAERHLIAALTNPSNDDARARLH